MGQATFLALQNLLVIGGSTLGAACQWWWLANLSSRTAVAG